MSWIRIGAAISMFAVMYGCEASDSFMVFKSKEAYLQSKVQLETTHVDSDLKKLVEMSDLVITGKLKKTRTLINSTEREKEMERSGENLPNLRSFVKGLVYEIEIGATLLNKTDSTEFQTVFVYTLGDPYSLHSTVARLQSDQEYLFFLSLPEKDELERLQILKQSETESDALGNNSLFAFVQGDNGRKEVTKDSNLLKRVKSLAKSAEKK